MRIIGLVLTATLISPSFIASSEECYDTGRKYKSKSALRSSNQKDFGFQKKCKEKMERQKESVISIANSKKNGEGMSLDSYLSPAEKKEMSVWSRLEQLKNQTKDRTVRFPEIQWWEPLEENHLRAPTKYGSRKFWDFNVGTRDSFTAQLKPFVGFFGSRIEAAGEAGVELSGSLMGVWNGKMGSARAVAFSPGTGPLSVDLQIFGPEGKQIWNQNLFRALELKFEKNMQQRIGLDSIWRFAIGPVPMAAEVGALGSVGVKNSLALYPLQVSAWGKPFIAAETYLMTGVDIWLFGTGTGGQLKLASDEVMFRGRSFVDYNDEPSIRLENTVNNDLTLLSGDIFAYIYLKLPLLRNKWMGKFTIFNWDGIDFNKNLLTSALILKKDRTLVWGDVDSSDTELMERISSEGTDTSIKETISGIIQEKIGQFSVYENETEKVIEKNKQLAELLR